MKKILENLRNKADSERKLTDIVLITGLLIITIPLIIACCNNIEVDIKKNLREGCAYIKNANSIMVDTQDRTEEEMIESCKTCLKHVMDDRENY